MDRCCRLDDNFCRADVFQYAAEALVRQNAERAYRNKQMGRGIVAYAGVFVVFGMHVRHGGNVVRYVAVLADFADSFCRERLTI